METNLIKANLKKFYDQEAEVRNFSEKENWKIKERQKFYNLTKSENKQTLLELGAGTGEDSQFFKDNGLKVLAIDLSTEMVRKCQEKSIEAIEMDFYSLAKLNKKFDCVWAMNSLLHVPKSDLISVLEGINTILSPKGLFYMGVYGGINTDSEYINEVSSTPRFFSYYCKSQIKEILSQSFQIIDFDQFDVGRNTEFQSIFMQKK